MKRILMSVAVTLAFSTILGGVAKADDIHLCATAAACMTNPNNVQFTGSTTAYVYGNATAGDTLYVVVLTPVADLSGNWNNNSTQLWNVLSLSESPSQQFPTLSAAICNLEGGQGCGTPTGFSAMSFNVKDFSVTSLNPWSGATDYNPASFTLPGSPAAGDMYMAFIENGSGQLTVVSPWSSSLLEVPVPEPSSLVLLGVGLLGFVGLAGRKLITA